MVGRRSAPVSGRSPSAPGPAPDRCRACGTGGVGMGRRAAAAGAAAAGTTSQASAWSAGRRPGDRSVSRPRRRFRTLDFFSRRWERNAFRRRRRPVPVTLMRLRAPVSVFIFGMASTLSFTRLVGRGCVPGLLCWCSGRCCCRRAASSGAACAGAAVGRCCWCRCLLPPVRRTGARRLARVRDPFPLWPGSLDAADCLARLSGASTMTMFRPSRRGTDSDLPIPSIWSAIRSRIFLPSSGWNTSRPRNMMVILTLWPSSRNLATCRVLVSKSPSPIFGRYFISLIPTWTALRLDSLARWAASNLNFP